MATKPSLQRHSSGMYRARFRMRIDGVNRQFNKSLRTTDEKKANDLATRIHETMEAIEKGFLLPPSSANLWDFLLTSGRVNGNNGIRTTMTLTSLFEKYETELPGGALEENTLGTYRIHKKHLLRILGDKTEVETLKLDGYIRQRLRERWRDKPIAPKTIKKEIETLRSVCNWANHRARKHLTAIPVFTGLVYGKGDEKPPFMTWNEIAERIGNDGASERLWDSLYLDVGEIDECLSAVQKLNIQPFVHAMFSFVAKTGARGPVSDFVSRGLVNKLGRFFFASPG